MRVFAVFGEIGDDFALELRVRDIVNDAIDGFEANGAHAEDGDFAFDVTDADGVSELNIVFKGEGKAGDDGTNLIDKGEEDHEGKEEEDAKPSEKREAVGVPEDEEEGGRSPDGDMGHGDPSLEETRLDLVGDPLDEEGKDEGNREDKEEA